MASWLCVPCYVNTDDADDQYHIFFVDLSKISLGKAGDCEYSDAQVPKLRVGKKFKFTSFWLKESTLFMISLKRSKSIGMLKLSEDFLRSNNHVSLEECMIRFLSPMNYRKRSPILVPTPDGKLIVMSSSIQSHFRDEWKGVRKGKGKGVERSVGVEKGGEPASDDDDESDSIFGLKVDFELYDPDKDEWEMLPPIQPCWPYTTFQSSCNVDWALFKDETTLLVKFSLPDRPGRVLQFEMDINERIWRLSKGVLGAARAGEMTITAVVRNELCFTPYKVVDNEHGSQSDLIPSSFDYKIYEHGFRSCFVFDEHYFYVVQASRLRNSLTAKLSVRKYFLNIEKYYLGRSELERRERGQHGIVMRNEITQMVRLGMPLEKLKLAISLLCEGRLKLKWGWQPPIEMELISSSQFVVDACTFIMPLQTLSLFQLPASQKRKRPSSSMC